VKLLLDTHSLLWALSVPEQLADDARGRISAPENQVFASAASVWEIAIKVSSGKLRAPADLAADISAAGFSELPITIEHGLAAGRLPRHHGDPFDRMLVAQASIEDLTLVTRDRTLAEYGVAILPA
jgi:PIN domain nuclease of toxin-antitoxin system